MINEKLKKLLYKSFDGKLTESEQQIYYRELETNPEFVKEKERVEELRTRVSSVQQPEFSDSFVDNVMNSIEQKPVVKQDEFFDSIFMSFKRAAVFALTVMVILFTIKITQVESVDEIFSQNEVTIDDVTNPLYYFD